MVGDFLLSHSVTGEVPSAYEGLTSVFGMVTGVPLQLLSPTSVYNCFISAMRQIIVLLGLNALTFIVNPHNNTE